MPTASQLRRAADKAVLPLPVATSNTFCPARKPVASHISSPGNAVCQPIIAKSPSAHVRCCCALTALRSTIHILLRDRVAAVDRCAQRYHGTACAVPRPAARTLLLGIRRRSSESFHTTGRLDSCLRTCSARRRRPEWYRG